jgi:hypothetical protein
MNLSIFTVEEENLISIFDAGGRTASIKAIRDAIPDFDEPEIRETAENVINILDVMTDAEFSALAFDPADSNDDEPEV